MDFNKRVKDVSQVFDSQWNTTHNYQERKAFLDGRKEHLKNMYEVSQKADYRKEILRANSVEGKVQNLNEKMNAVNANQRLARQNEFRNNFR